jgi:hypothetical protein
MSQDKLVNLDRTDVYPGDNIPEEAVEECLKVLRSIRNAALSPEGFNASAAVMLSHCHSRIHDWCRMHNNRVKREQESYGGQNSEVNVQPEDSAG